MPEEPTQECIFCKIASRQISVPLEYENDRVAAFKDINPQAPIHTLIIPKVHVPKIGELTEKDGDILMALMQAANHLARQYGIYEEGYRIVLNSGANGGQTVFHLHLHLLGGRFMGWPPG